MVFVPEPTATNIPRRGLHATALPCVPKIVLPVRPVHTVVFVLLAILFVESKPTAT